jgi:anti-anti-sigma factor
VELDDLESPRDRSIRLGHERQTAEATFPRDHEEPMQGRAVDEEDATQVDHERPACGGRAKLYDEVVGVAEVELARDDDDGYLWIAVLHVLELECSHRRDRICARPFADRAGGNGPDVATSFAHPVERALAHLFDEHGIAWEYEPHTFVLESDGDGTVREAFTPDFFLPEIGAYVECTVMRPALTRRKRPKARRVRENVGAVVEIMFRRDVDRLAQRWGIPGLAAAGRVVPEVSLANGAGTEAGTMNQQTGALEQGTRVRIRTERYGESWVVTVVGDVDLHSAPELRDRLASLGDTGAKHVVVDLSDCEFLDSMGLGVLLGAKKRMARDGRDLHVVVTSPDVRRIFEITMLDRVLDLHATRAEALSGDRARRPV